jgi:hypothetical protein
MEGTVPIHHFPSPFTCEIQDEDAWHSSFGGLWSLGMEEHVVTRATPWFDHLHWSGLPLAGAKAKDILYYVACVDKSKYRKAIL